MAFTYDPENIFARILRGEIPNKTVYESDHALAFHDIRPQTPVHVLVIPKGPYTDLEHFISEATPEEQFGFWVAVRATRAALGLENGYRAIANIGPDSRQEVPHFHLHLLGGKELGTLLA